MHSNIMELISLTPTSCRTISNMRSLTSCLKHSLFATSIVAKILFIAPSGSDILFSRNSFRLAWVMSTSNWLRVMIVPYMSKRHQPHCRGVGSFQGANTITVRPNSCIADLRKSCSTTRSPTCWLTLNASNQIYYYVGFDRKCFSSASITSRNSCFQACEINTFAMPAAGLFCSIK